MQRALAVVAMLVAMLVARRWAPAGPLDRISAALRWRWTPVVAGVVTALLLAWTWGSLQATPVLHDEIAYLTQARIYATLHIYAAARPLPEFFEQYHMFVTPEFMAKYPPGQPALLVPGVWLGLPALMPLVFAGVAGAFTYALVRRISNEWVALTAWMLWTSTTGILNFLPSYFSQTTSCALWLIGWWSLLRWREDGARKWLLLLAGCVGVGVLTHPFTWLLFAIPVAPVVLVIAVRRRQWRDLAYAAALGCGCLAVLLAWNWSTMGSALQFPWSVYARTYFPFDRIGFGVDSTPPLRTLSPDMMHLTSMFRAIHEQHTLEAAPAHLVTQLVALARDLWGDWRFPLGFLAVLGLVAIQAELGFALISCAVVVAGYMLYAHPAIWTLYYVEVYPVLAYVTALGIWRLFEFLGNPGQQLRQLQLPQPSRQAAMGILVVGLLFCPLYRSSLHTWRQLHELRARQLTAFNTGVAALPGAQTVVFVRYDPRHNPNLTLISNAPDANRARAWKVYDRGLDDIRLTRLAPDRVPYLFDETTNSFTRMDTSALAAAVRSVASRSAGE